MEHYVVLAYEVHQPCVLVLPPLLPRAPLLGLAVAELLGVGYIADRRVKPYVEHLALCTLHWHRYAPVEVASHGARLQVHVEPALALTIYVGAPLLVVLQYPFLQPVLILAQRQIPVLRGALHQSVSGIVLVCRVDELVRRERGTTLLTLVAVGVEVMTARTLAHDVSVRKELARHLVAILLLGYLLQLALII